MVILNLQNCADSLPGASYGAMIKIIFAYSPGGNGYKLDLGMNYHQRFTGEQRNQVEKARRITAEQKVVLDKIRNAHRFFEDLDILCNSVKEVRNSASLLPVYDNNAS